MPINTSRPSALMLRILAEYADDSEKYQVVSAAIVAVTNGVREAFLGSLRAAFLIGSTPTALHCPVSKIVRRQLDSIAPHCSTRELDEISDDLLLVAYDEFRRAGQRIRGLTGTLTTD